MIGPFQEEAMFEAERYTTFGYTVSMVDGKLRRLPYPEFNENS